MNYLRNFCAAVVLTFAVTASAMGGIMETGATQPPPPPSDARSTFDHALTQLTLAVLNNVLPLF